MAHEFTVEFEEQDGGPEPELRERFAVAASRRLGKLEGQGRPYPAAGDTFDILDAFSGPFVWEMTDEQLEATPPSSVDLEVVSVDPPADAGSGPVHVVARIPF
jgi:hypothetical protein